MKATQCPPMDKRINKMRYIYTMEYFSAFKRKEILTSATIWMKIEDMTLSKKSQTPKDKYCTTPLIWSTWSSRIHRDGMYDGNCQGLGSERGVRNGQLFNRYQVSVLQDEMSSRNGWWWWIQNNMNILNATQPYTFQQLRLCILPQFKIIKMLKINS